MSRPANTTFCRLTVAARCARLMNDPLPLPNGRLTRTIPTRKPCRRSAEFACSIDLTASQQTWKSQKTALREFWLRRAAPRVVIRCMSRMVNLATPTITWEGQSVSSNQKRVSQRAVIKCNLSSRSPATRTSSMEKVLPV